MRIQRLMVLYRSSFAEEFYCKIKSGPIENGGYFSQDQIKVSFIILFYMYLKILFRLSLVTYVIKLKWRYDS